MGPVCLISQDRYEGRVRSWLTKWYLLHGQSRSRRRVLRWSWSFSDWVFVFTVYRVDRQLSFELWHTYGSLSVSCNSNDRIVLYFATVYHMRRKTVKQFHVYTVLKKRVPFLFLLLLCVILTDDKHILHYCSKGNLKKTTCISNFILIRGILL